MNNSQSQKQKTHEIYVKKGEYKSFKDMIVKVRVDHQQKIKKDLSKLMKMVKS